MHILQPFWLKLLEHLRLRRWVGRLLGALEPRQLREVRRLPVPPGASPGRAFVGVARPLPSQGWAPADATGTDLLLHVRQHPLQLHPHQDRRRCAVVRGPGRFRLLRVRDCSSSAVGFRDSLVPSSSLPADRGADGWYPDNRARRLARYCDPLDGWQPTAARVKVPLRDSLPAACTTGYSSATPT